MPTQLQLRRGTTAQHASFTGADGELTINTSKKVAVVHDGSTVGGKELLRADMTNVDATSTPSIASLTTTGNVNVGGNLTVTGTTTFNGGTITMGDADTDNVVFGADVNSNIVPNTDNTYSLGTVSKKWSDVRTNTLNTTGAASLGSTANVVGNFSVNTDKFTVNAGNGNTAIEGTAAITGNVAIGTDKVTIEASTGNTNIKGTLNAESNFSVATSKFTSNASTGNAVIAGDLAVNGGDLTTSQTTFNLLNTTATTLNVGGAATSLNLGAGTGTTTVNNNLTVTGNLTVSGTTTTVDSTTVNIQNAFVFEGATADNFETTLTTVDPTADRTLSLPDATDTLVGRATSDTLTNKSISLTTNTITGTKAEFNAAMTDADFATLAGSETLTNKSISLTTNTITGTKAEFNAALSDGDFATLAGTETLTNKTLTTPIISSISNTGTLTLPTSTDTLVGRATTDTLTNKTLTTPVISSISNSGTITIPTGTDTLVGRATTDTLTNKSIDLTSNTITGTLAQFNTALSDDNFVSLTGTETLTNKTLTTPVISSVSNSGTITIPTGTDTLVGKATTDTLTNKSINLANNIITGTTAEFNTALSDDNFVTISGAETLTNKTLTSPVITTISTTSNSNISLSPDGTGVVNVPAGYTGRAGFGANSLVPKSYIDALEAGLHVHASVKAATTDTLAVLTGGTVTYDNGTAGNGATLTLQNALTTLDTSYTVVSGDRLLIKNQANAAHNGIYTIDATKTILTRATDFDSVSEVASGDFLFVSNGTQFGNQGFVQTIPMVTVGTTNISFTQFSGAGQIIAGNGLTKDGNTIDAVGTADRITVNANSIDIASTYAGQNTITTLGTISSGTWQGSAIAGQYGGTGVNNSGKTLTLGGNFTHTGAHTLGLTTTANTSITLPTTGTVATLDGSETLTNKNLELPKIVPNGYGLAGIITNNSTLVLRINETLGAVNELAINNAATGNNPTLSATGSDANVGLNITPKGTGVVVLGNTETAAGKTLALSGSSSGKTTLNVAATASGTLTLPSATDTLVGRATTDTLTNKTLTSPVISSISNTGTLTLPTSTDTLVGRTTTDTLTNKTLTSPVISSISNTGTLTLPTSTDTLVGRATTDTLTNKTLTSPIISTISNTGTLTLPTSTDTLVGRATTDTLTNKTIGAATISGNLIPNANATIDLGSAANKFRHLYLDGASLFMGSTKVSMHADGYFVFNNNSAGGYPSGSNVSVATATNGVGGGGGVSSSTAAALAIALGGM